MSVKNRHPNALTGDHRLCRLHDLPVFNPSPQTQRLLFALLLLAANIGNNILHHLRPILKSLSCSGDRLIGSRHHLIRLKLLPRCQHRRIALDGAIRLYCNKPSLCSQTLPLRLNHLKMLRVDLRNHHGYILCPAMSAVVGNHRHLRPGISLLNRPNLILAHIHGAEYHIHLSGNLLHLIDIHHHHILHRLRHRSIHLPTASHRLLIRLSGRTGTGRHCRHLKPRMLL